MTLRTELVSIPKGTDWTTIEVDTDYSFDLQNIAGIVMEYTYTLPMTRGSQLFAEERLADNTQDVHVRFLDTIDTQGDISLVRDSNA